jgi:CRISPR-associated protein Cas5t
MTGVYVTVPIACFRKGLAREFLETERLPPPSTCYGFLLSLVGETNRRSHLGCRVSPAIIAKTEGSVVLRTVWRVKKMPLGSPGNTRPDYQQLLTGVELVMWIDSSDEQAGGNHLESRIQQALDPAQRHNISRFGGLSLGESTHLVDEVRPFPGDQNQSADFYLLSPRGRLTLPVWVDHVGSAGTRYVTGDVVRRPLLPPGRDEMPMIQMPG